MTAQQILALILSLATLGGFYGYKQTYPTPADAKPYHAKVAAAVDAVPRQFGGWLGRDVEVPAQAVELLKPNALLSRNYVHPQTGRSVSILVVHCQTSRDLAGHYPPICYPSAGWIARGETSAPLAWGDTTMPFMRYTFRRSLATEEMSINVWNVLMVPDAAPTPSMQSVRDKAEGYLTHFFGAGQVQFLFHARVPREEQEAIIAEFRPQMQPVFDAVRQANAGTME